MIRNYYEKFILTNADNVKQKELGLINLHYELFSLNFNPLKNNPEYYKIFLEKYNLNSDNVIYFEHNLEAVKSAISIGIKTFHYDKETKDLIYLEKFLKENI